MGVFQTLKYEQHIILICTMRQVISLVLLGSGLAFRYTREVREPCDNSANMHTDENGACVENECVCANGTAVANADCTSHGDTQCSGCDGDLRLENKLCHNAVNVQNDAEHVPCDNAANKHRNEAGECVDNVCNCDNGTPAAAGTCTSNGNNQCSICNAGFNMDNNNYCVAASASGCGEGEHFDDEAGSCQPDVCVCTNGTLDAANCQGHGRESCSACDDGWKREQNGYCLEVVCPIHTNRVGENCVQKECTCANGSAMEGGACQDDTQDMCLTCNEGYFRNASMACEAMA